VKLTELIDRLREVVDRDGDAEFDELAWSSTAGGWSLRTTQEEVRYSVPISRQLGERKVRFAQGVAAVVPTQ
jgi:hypothetical protein